MRTKPSLSIDEHSTTSILCCWCSGFNTLLFKKSFSRWNAKPSRDQFLSLGRCLLLASSRRRSQVFFSGAEDEFDDVEDIEVKCRSNVCFIEAVLWNYWLPMSHHSQPFPVTRISALMRYNLYATNAFSCTYAFEAVLSVDLHQTFDSSDFFYSYTTWETTKKSTMSARDLAVVTVLNLASTKTMKSAELAAWAVNRTTTTLALTILETIGTKALVADTKKTLTSTTYMWPTLVSRLIFDSIVADRLSGNIPSRTYYPFSFVTTLPTCNNLTNIWTDNRRIVKSGIPAVWRDSQCSDYQGTRLAKLSVRFQYAFQQASPTLATNSLFFTNLSYAIEYNESLITSVTFTNPNHSYLRTRSGFGFVSFFALEDCEKALAAMHGADLDGRSIRVEKARRNNGYQKTPGVCK